MRAAGTALVLALLGGCSATAQPVAPRPPASVQVAWPGCAAVKDGRDDPYVERAGVGGVPEGFVATAAVLCEQSEREDATGSTVGVDLERTANDVGPLLAYLAQPDERPTSGACTADGWAPPTLYLLDTGGGYVAPAIPVDGCGKPLGWEHRDAGLAWETLPYTDRVVRTR